MMERKGLGRGLSALLADVAPVEEPARSGGEAQALPAPHPPIQFRLIAFDPILTSHGGISTRRICRIWLHRSGRKASFSL